MLKNGEKKKALILMLGGTIAMEKINGTYSATVKGRKAFIADLKGDDILGSDRFKETLDTDIKHLCDVDSTNIKPGDWEKIAAAIDYHQKDYDFVVCTHGTDTLTHTASAVSFAFHDFDTLDHEYMQGNRLYVPVVFTGAQKPVSDRSGDGIRNITSALEAGMEASEKDVTDVLIAFDKEILLGVNSHKRSDLDYDAFTSNDGTNIGVVRANGVTLHNANLAITTPFLAREWKRANHDRKTPLPLGKFVINHKTADAKATGSLVPLKMEPGITFETVNDNYLSPHALAFVVSSLGAGNIPDDGIAGIKSGIEETGVLTLVVSPFDGGAVHITYALASEAQDAGAVFSGDQSFEAIWIKAHWLIANGFVQGFAEHPEQLMGLIQTPHRGEGSALTVEVNAPAPYTEGSGLAEKYEERVSKNYALVEAMRAEDPQQFSKIKLPKRIPVPLADPAASATL